MKYVEQFLIFALLILMPITFFNLIGVKWVLEIAFTITGTYYMLFLKPLLEGVEIASLLKFYKGLKFQTIIKYFLVGIGIYTSLTALSLKFDNAPGATILSWITVIIFVISLSILLIRYRKTKNDCTNSIFFNIKHSILNNT